MDQSIVLWCAVAPAAVIVTGAIVATGLHPRYRAAAVALAWWLAVAIPIARQGWPCEAWQQTLWPLLGWAVVAGLAMSPLDAAWRWFLAGLLAITTAMFVMPGGEQWADTFALHRPWMGAVATSCLVNSFAIDRMARRNAERWCLWVAVAGVGGPMALAASCYASLAEWSLAVAVATAAAASIGAAFRSIPASPLTAPSLAAIAIVTGAGRFYTYDDHPTWVYAAMLYGPALVAGVDRLACLAGGPDRSSASGPLARLRIATAGLVSCVLVAACSWRIWSG